MADEEHLVILQQGIETWNQWKKENKAIIPSLKEVDLSDTDLSSVDFSRTDLRKANLANARLTAANLTEANLSYACLDGAELCWANLTEANLSWASLSKADLSEAMLIKAVLVAANFNQSTLGGVILNQALLQMADLRNADISAADLTSASLTRANLRWANLSHTILAAADLREANLSDAILTGADLRQAIFKSTILERTILSRTKMGYTTLGDVDLSLVFGLDTVVHSGPSIVGIDTIYRSQGDIPEEFLRKAGTPDDFITYMKSLTGAAFEFYSCFISHSTEDSEFAERLYADLRAKGVSCWFAPHDMKTGELIRQTIHDQIHLHEKTLVVLSKNSVTSWWVENEVENAMEEEKKQNKLLLFPVRLDDTVFQANNAWVSDIRRRHIADFTTWKDHDSYQEAFNKLLRDLKAEKSTS